MPDQSRISSVWSRAARSLAGIAISTVKLAIAPPSSSVVGFATNACRGKQGADAKN